VSLYTRFDFSGYPDSETSRNVYCMETIAPTDGLDRSILTKYVFKCAHQGMSFTPKAIQDLLDEFAASKQSRLRAWNVLQRLRSVLSEAGHVAIPPPAQKSFDAEGEALERALTKSLRIRNDAIKSLCSSVRRFRDGLSRRNAKATIRTHFRLCGTRWNGRMPCTTTEHDGASPSFEALPVC
jgi:hypothetical protein